jgi:hypothetical protein
MKIKSWFFLAALGALSMNAMAKEVTMACHERIYVCADTPSGAKACDWATRTGKELTVELQKDPSFPSEAVPYEIWRGTYKTQIHNGPLVEMSFQSSTDPKWSPVYAGLRPFSWRDFRAVA